MGKLIDLTNQRFGFWMVENRGKNTESGHAQWLCLCECGIKRLITSNSLRTGNSTSCGCNHSPNLIGQIFSKLKVISLAISKDKTRRYWICRCKCNNIVIVSTYRLREKLTESCGCVAEQIKKTVLISEKFSILLNSATIRFAEAEKLICISKNLSKQTGAATINQGLDIMRAQMQIIGALNKELQQNIAHLYS